MEEQKYLKEKEKKNQKEPTTTKYKKSFKCDYDNCPYSFTRKEHLIRHIRTHTGNKPFCCPFAGCTKNFTRPDNLTNHIQSHQTKQRNFQLVFHVPCSAQDFEHKSTKVTSDSFIDNPSSSLPLATLSATVPIPSTSTNNLCLPIISTSSPAPTSTSTSSPTSTPTSTSASTSTPTLITSSPLSYSPLPCILSKKRKSLINGDDTQSKKAKGRQQQKKNNVMDSELPSLRSLLMSPEDTSQKSLVLPFLRNLQQQQPVYSFQPIEQNPPYRIKVKEEDNNNINDTWINSNKNADNWLSFNGSHASHQYDLYYLKSTSNSTSINCKIIEPSCTFVNLKSQCSYDHHLLSQFNSCNILKHH